MSQAQGERNLGSRLKELCSRVRRRDLGFGGPSRNRNSVKRVLERKDERTVKNNYEKNRLY